MRNVFWNLLTNILSEKKTKIFFSLCNAVSFSPSIRTVSHVNACISRVHWICFRMFSCLTCMRARVVLVIHNTHTHSLYCTRFCGLLILFSYVSLWSIEKKTIYIFDVLWEYSRKCLLSNYSMDQWRISHDVFTFILSTWKDAVSLHL